MNFEKMETTNLETLGAYIAANGIKNLGKINIPDGHIDLVIGWPQTFGLESSTFDPIGPNGSLIEVPDVSLVVHATVTASSVAAFDQSKEILESLAFNLFDEKEDIEFDRFLNLDIDLADLLETVQELQNVA